MLRLWNKILRPGRYSWFLLQLKRVQTKAIPSFSSFHKGHQKHCPPPTPHDPGLKATLTRQMSNKLVEDTTVTFSYIATLRAEIPRNRWDKSSLSGAKEHTVLSCCTASHSPCKQYICLHLRRCKKQMARDSHVRSQSAVCNKISLLAETFHAFTRSNMTLWGGV